MSGPEPRGEGRVAAIPAEQVKAEALRLGFSRVGIVRPQQSEHVNGLRRWLKRGFEGDMAWMGRDDALERRASGNTGWSPARSIVVVAHSYAQPDPPGVPDDPSRAVIARYARGRDYHHVVLDKLRALLGWAEGQAAPWGVDAVRGRAYVDTGPLLERELAQRAGFGWFGRNTMLIDPQAGSYFFIGALLLDVELATDPPFVADRCGTCHACLDACPTGALLGRDEHGAPVMDARRCISYLTIEHRGAIPQDLRPLMGNRVFGCDICQEVCPWTVKFGSEQGGQRGQGGQGAHSEYKPAAWPVDREGEPALPSLDGPDLVEFTERILAMSGKEYQRVFAQSPLARPGRKRMLRNLCVALGNYGATSPEAAQRVRSVLERAAADPSELVREHVEWGLARLRRSR